MTVAEKMVEILEGFSETLPSIIKNWETIDEELQESYILDIEWIFNVMFERLERSEVSEDLKKISLKELGWRQRNKYYIIFGG